MEVNEGQKNLSSQGKQAEKQGGMAQPYANDRRQLFASPILHVSSTPKHSFLIVQLKGFSVAASPEAVKNI